MSPGLVFVKSFAKTILKNSNQIAFFRVTISDYKEKEKAIAKFFAAFKARYLLQKYVCVCVFFARDCTCVFFCK